MNGVLLRRVAIASALLLLAVALWRWPAGERRESPVSSAPVEAADSAPAAPVGGQRARGGLSGHVLDASGRPLPGAEILLRVSGREQATRADAAGAFEFAELAEGEYLLDARHGSLAAETLGPVPLGEGESLQGLELVVEPGVSISGTVTDAADDRPIEGALLRLSESASVRTDRAGRFFLGPVPPAEHALEVKAEGYERFLRLQKFVAGETSGVKIHLRRAANLAGRVLDEAGAPVPHAAISVQPYSLGQAPAGVARARADEQGRFALSIPPGAFELQGQGPSGAHGSLSLEAAPGQSLEGIELRLVSLSALRGRVLRADGTPAPFADVSAVGNHPSRTKADDQGVFHLAAPGAGKLRLMASLDGAIAVTGPVDASADEIVLRLGSGTLRGVVEGGPGADVLVRPDGFLDGARVRADVEGRFAIGGLPEGPLRVEAVLGKARAERQGVFAGEEIALRLGSGRLVGHVHFGSHVVGDFLLSASPRDPGVGGGVHRRFFSPDGRFELSLPPGSWEVRVESAGARTTGQIAEVPAEGDSEELRFVLVPAESVFGVVLDEEGAPIAGARVSTSRNGVFAFGTAGEVPGPAAVMTDASGRFRLEGLPAEGRAPVFAHKNGFRFSRPAWVELPPPASPLELRLRRGGATQTSFAGVGMTLGSRRDGSVVAAEVVPGGPAFEAGIRPGDRILSVDGVPARARSMAEVIDAVRGEEGTAVRLELQRGGTSFRVAPLRARMRF